MGSGGSSGRGVGYHPRGPGFESQSGPNQFIIASPCPPSTKWGTGGGARTRDRRIPVDIGADSLATLPPTPHGD
ncbi:hypothetical protein PoB_001275900 [Plakobranchus ocellatus]|uniref:Uncharacterized protein n=1 Tax=Plakobranchus ocellatus TaxID=259542 RepID=A0AAV3YW25_9GAST|nr:hypothetical protein PoB_001275900 [Plakobranchus ocellatus]